MNTATKGLNRRRGIIKVNRASGLKANWLLLVPALVMVAAAATAFGQSLPVSHDSSQIIQFLNQTIDWYRHATAVQQTATEVDDFALVADNARMANQTVRLAFDFAKAEAQDIGKQGNASTSQRRSKCRFSSATSIGSQTRQASQS